MEWEIVVAPIARKRLEKIPQPDRRRILLTINRLSEGLVGDVKPLKGRDDWRLRVGGWRVILSVDMEKRVIKVKYIDVRGDVYKG